MFIGTFIACTGTSVVVADSPPAFTSASSATFPQGLVSTFTITTSGSPAPTITVSGSLPGGIRFVNNGDGTATLTGRPGTGLGHIGDYPLTFTASNGVSPAATQTFTLTISRPPLITSVNNATFVVGTSNLFTVTTRNSKPKTTLGYTGTLPSGVSFVASNGSAAISGTPPSGSEGTFQITITGTNGTLPNATQTFMLTVQDTAPPQIAPTITSAASTTFTGSTEGNFTVTTTGTPTASLTLGGDVPEWLSFIDNTDGTATLVGTPDATSHANYLMAIIASNGVLPDAVQAFNLTVIVAPAFTSSNAATFTVGAGGTFQVTTTGIPTAALNESGLLPSGVTFTDNGNGTGTLTGTPAAGSAGLYNITFSATNGVPPDATQQFRITVTGVGSPTPTPTPTPSPTQRLENISTRGVVQTGNGVLIGGFVLQGNTPKEILARGLGPSLSAFGVLNPLGNPLIEIHDSSGALISSNDNWQTDSNSGAIPAALQPSNALESALDRTLSPGSYTVIMKGAQGQTGVGLFELYELNGTGSILANISTRGIVQTGDDVMIGGFIVTGDANVTQRVIIRAIGPSLARFGVTNCLLNPHLRVFDSNGTLIGENDDWQSMQAAEIGATGLAPVDPLESAIILNLPVGSYTAVVFGTNGGTGNGLVEVYTLGQ